MIILCGKAYQPSLSQVLAFCHLGWPWLGWPHLAHFSGPPWSVSGNLHPRAEHFRSPPPPVLLSWSYPGSYLFIYFPVFQLKQKTQKLRKLLSSILKCVNKQNSCFSEEKFWAQVLNKFFLFSLQNRGYLIFETEVKLLGGRSQVVGILPGEKTFFCTVRLGRNSRVGKGLSLASWTQVRNEAGHGHQKRLS